MVKGNCESAPWLTFGHKFEARYDLDPPPGMKLNGAASEEGAVRILEAATKRTYVRDVCVRCGMTIERKVR